MPVHRTRLQGNEAGELVPVRGVVGSFEEGEPARIAILDPGMVGAIELDHFPQGGFPGPDLSVPLAPLPRLPASLGEKPGAKGIGVERADVWVPGQVLGGERGAEVVELGLLGRLQDSGPERGGLGVVRCPSSVPVHDRPVPLRFKPTSEPSELPGREIDKLGPSTRCHKALIYLTQYHEAITIPEAQGQHLLPRCQTYLLYPTFPRRPTVQRGLVFPIRSWPSVRLASSFPSFGRSGALLCPKWKWGRRCGTGGPAGGRTEQASGAGFGGPVCPEPGA